MTHDVRTTMSRFAHLFSGLMTWNLDGWWWLTLPMTEREWNSYYVLDHASDDIMVGAKASLDQINDTLELRAELATRDIDGDPIDRREGSEVNDARARAFERVMDLGRARLAYDHEET